MESWTAGGVVVNRELLKGKALSYWWTSVFLPSPVDTNSGAKERVVDTNSQTHFLCRVCELRAETRLLHRMCVI